MKRIVSAALVASLMAGSALAQPPDRGGRGEGPRAERGDGGGRQGGRPNAEQRQQGGQRGEQRQQQPRPEQPRQQPQAEQRGPELQGGPQPGRGSYLRSPDDRRQEWRGGDPRQNQPQARPDNRRDDNRRDDNRRPDARPDPRDNRGQPQWRGNDNRGQQWNPQRQFRDRDRGRPQFDQRRYRPIYRAPQRFRITPYRAPPGFYVRSWTFGDRLPYGWYGPTYYLSWGAYGLPLPPIGCEWIRVGSDALLVDVWTGEVLSVYYDLFW